MYTDEYWGDKKKYKFRVRIDSFDNQTEVGQGSERIVRTTFTMAVNAFTYYQKNLTINQHQQKSLHQKE